MGITTVVEELLPLPHHAHISVIQVDDLDRQVVLFTGRQLLNTHHDTGFTSNARNGCFGMSELYAHRRWQAEAHRPKSARVNPSSRFVETVILGSPHLMLSYI